jgi:hypothetical protein
MSDVQRLATLLKMGTDIVSNPAVVGVADLIDSGLSSRKEGAAASDELKKAAMMRAGLQPSATPDAFVEEAIAKPIKSVAPALRDSVAPVKEEPMSGSGWSPAVQEVVDALPEDQRKIAYERAGRPYTPRAVPASPTTASAPVIADGSDPTASMYKELPQEDLIFNIKRLNEKEKAGKASLDERMQLNLLLDEYSTRKYDRDYPTPPKVVNPGAPAEERAPSTPPVMPVAPVASVRPVEELKKLRADELSDEEIDAETTRLERNLADLRRRGETTAKTTARLEALTKEVENRVGAATYTEAPTETAARATPSPFAQAQLAKNERRDTLRAKRNKTQLEKDELSALESMVAMPDTTRIVEEVPAEENVYDRAMREISRDESAELSYEDWQNQQNMRTPEGLAAAARSADTVEKQRAVILATRDNYRPAPKTLFDVFSRNRQSPEKVTFAKQLVELFPKAKKDDSLQRNIALTRIQAMKEMGESRVGKERRAEEEQPFKLAYRAEQSALAAKRGLAALIQARKKNAGTTVVFKQQKEVSDEFGKAAKDSAEYIASLEKEEEKLKQAVQQKPAKFKEKSQAEIEEMESTESAAYFRQKKANDAAAYAEKRLKEVAAIKATEKVNYNKYIDAKNSILRKTFGAQTNYPESEGPLPKK